MSDVYVTEQGDAWDHIAFKALGSEGYMDRLMLCNPEHLHRVIFPAGIVLKLPVIERKATDKNGLPPWRR